MSDVYAMGGQVRMALNICAFPNDMPQNIIEKILQGGADKVLEAGGVIAGGHTIDDDEPKYGLSVMGTTEPSRILEKTGAAEGDVLILTKPLGSGIITTAAKKGFAAPEHTAEAVEVMKQLNKTAAEIIYGRASACTDVTGFSLIGHANEIASKSGLRFVIEKNSLPFITGAKEYAEAGIFPGGSGRNRNCYKELVSMKEAVNEGFEMLLYTPETSGGLLASIGRDKIAGVLEDFRKEGVSAWVIGETSAGTGIEVV